jgi:NAD(P)-dependent dehydrogenase (short-subunit alcohol dehydrogenase family)
VKGNFTMTNGMNVANKTVLITGANRGVGRALVNEALKRGAKRVYAAARGPLEIADERVTPLTLDVTNTSQVRRAVTDVGTLDVLINNALPSVCARYRDSRLTARLSRPPCG